MTIVDVKNLSKKYKNATVAAVDNISFDVQKGEFFAFLGPNGAGKTTTISILTTTLAKTSGTVKIAGFDIDSEASRVRSEIGVIFQNPSLDLNLSAEENIRFHAQLYNLYPFKPGYNFMPSEYKNKVESLAEVLGIQKEIFNPIKSFSGGMKRKLEIIRTLIHKPKVLFLDEPTSGLDPVSRKNLWSYLKTIREQENTTIFLTTHYLDEAEGADRVCVINQGKISLIDTISNMKNKLLSDFVLIEADDKDELKAELDSVGYPYTVEEHAFKIIVKNSKAHDFVKKIKTKVKRIIISQPTLEEAYIDLINEKYE